MYKVEMGKEWRCDVPYFHCGCSRNSYIHVDHDRDMVFFEVPRVASTSMKRTLWGGKGEKAVDNDGFRRMETPEYRKMLSSGKINNYTIFSAARNPWSRLFSTFQYITLAKDTGGTTREFLQADWEYLPSWEEFMEKFDEEGYRNLHWLPCTNYYPEEVDLDYVIRFENLKEDWKELGLPIPMRRANIETNYEKPHYSEAYTEDWMVDKVREFFKSDIERFGYEFEEGG